MIKRIFPAMIVYKPTLLDHVVYYASYLITLVTLTIMLGGFGYFTFKLACAS